MKKLLSALILLLITVNCFAVDTKVIHVTVALCDNKYQGIVTVSSDLGNGQNPVTNLYWGAMYGVKTYFGKHPDWTLVHTETDTVFPVRERIVFKHKHSDTYIVADAYDGKHMKETVTDFLNYSAGNNSSSLKIGDSNLKIGGDAGLVIFVGHNGLMDFKLSSIKNKIKQAPKQNMDRSTAVFACKSKSYFEDELLSYGVKPLILTTGLMAPEAYSVEALAAGWIAGKTNIEIKSMVAQAYDKYQKSGINFASKLFYTSER